MINNKTNARETMAFLDCHVVMVVFWHVYHEARRKSRKCGFYKGTTTKKVNGQKMLTESSEVELNADVKHSQITESKKRKSEEATVILKTFMQVTSYGLNRSFLGKYMYIQMHIWVLSIERK